MGAGLTACSIPGMKLHVESSRQSELHNASKSSWKTFSATLRRGFPTSRRHFNTSLSRRDVYCYVATSNSKALCHVATWNSHVATWNSHVATSFSHIATSFGQALCHVATLPRTSRRHLVLLSATSRRCPARRDVAKLSSLSSRDVTPHVATWPCF